MPFILLILFWFVIGFIAMKIIMSVYHSIKGPKQAPPIQAQNVQVTNAPEQPQTQAAPNAAYQAHYGAPQGEPVVK